MTLTREDPQLSLPIEDVTQLADFIRRGEKPRERWRVGTEHEKLALCAESKKPVPYAGERGIRSLLEAVCRDYDFAPLYDGDALVGAERDGAAITLEPGGQLELSGAPFVSLFETCREFNEHLALMKHVSEPLGMVWLGLGMHPFAPLAELPRVPRERYTVMRRHMESRDSLGLYMMHATAGVQASFDFADEADMAKKLRVGLAASPFVTALYANSSLTEGEPNGFMSRRARVWRSTDPDRCGFLPFVFEPDFGAGNAFARYVDWALDVPMIFIMREGRHIPLTLCFRDYLARGFEGHRATLADWSLHLTTLFPEVRLKHVLEVRGADAVPPSLVCALPALWKGLWYSDSALARARARLEGLDHAAADALHLDVARNGLAATSPIGPVAQVARDLVDLAAEGLREIGHTNRAGDDERGFLDPLYAILDRGASPGRQLLERWRGDWGKRADLLVEYARY